MNILKNKLTSTILAVTAFAFVMSAVPELYAVHHDHEIDHERERKNCNRHKIKDDKANIKKAEKNNDSGAKKKHKEKKKTHEKRLRKHDNEVHKLKVKHNCKKAKTLGKIVKASLGF